MERASDRRLMTLTEAEYFAAEGVSSSQLRCLATDGPFIYYHKHVAKTLPPRDSDSMKLGRLLHRAMEYDGWRDELVLMPEGDGRTKAVKAAIEDAKLQLAEGKTLSRLEDVETTSRMVDAIYENPEAASYLDRGLKEQAGFATCELTGRVIKAKADLLRPDCVVDYKTTRRHNAEGFRHEALHSYGYHFQAEWYMRVFGRARFIIVAVTSEAPYEAMVYEFEPPVIEEAESMNDYHIATLHSLLEDGTPEIWHSENWGALIPLGYERIGR